MLADLPPLDTELLPLLDLSSPSLSSHASIAERFDSISEHLFQRCYLVCCSTKSDGSPRRVLYELLEFEFYLIKVDCHSDPFTHDGAEQRLSGSWYFHRVPRHRNPPNSGLPAYRGGSRKGLDLTIGMLDSPDPSITKPVPVRGGILLRTLRRVSDSTVISGPSLLVDELLRASGAADIPELVDKTWRGNISAFRSPSTTEGPDSNPSTLYMGTRETRAQTAQTYKSPRVGIDLSHPSTRLDPSDGRVRFVSKPYRYFVHPRRLTANGRGHTFLGVHDHCANALQLSKTPAALAGKIADLTGLQPHTVDKYLKTYREALDSGELDGFVGFRGKGAGSSPNTFLQLMGALQRRKLVR
ncbi:hypothetical protein F5148DRAFT_972214 [Russula earlei]|uniref:Uncharacterized protein n=1 Tax=Russula earlei TaxID=71964 RepID=A0ACC0UNS3_9AGAM|nr:hypothetical protein F5148DRAFT_972214 [Russula earlei]